MKQSKALAILKSGKNVFLTGSAGAGKTYVLNQYIQYLRSHKIGVAITASTGIASTHINGMTIHSWSGIGIREVLSLRYLNQLKERKYFRDKMEKTKVLVIDEISMLHKNQLELVDQVLRHFKDPFLPFGGIQVVFSGDFFQLPPIGSDGETSKDKFAFMAKAWVEAELAICYITEQHRQSDKKFNQILNDIRDGNVENGTFQILENRIDYFRDEEDQSTRLYTHNYDVDRINQNRLENLSGSERTFQAETKGNEVLVEILKKSVLTDENLKLKIGAQVMFIKNNFEVGYINGTLGTITGFNDKGFPLVLVKSNDILEAKPEIWSINDEFEKPLASYTQVPLRLAWAITIHKSQGMTLDSAIIDLGKAFEKGQGYVALSRLKTLDGLKLYGLNETALEIDTLAMKADKRFRELAQWIDDNTDEDELAKYFKEFILRNGGTLDKREMPKIKEKLELKQKNAKKPTVEITLDLVNEGMSIKQIAEKRGISSSTIVEHLAKIKLNFPAVSLEKYKPKNEIIDKVGDAKKLNHESSLNEFGQLKKMYEYFEGKITYEEIKLALIFVE